MIQPTLLSYSFNGPPEPALLDAQSVRPDAIFLLDTFFHVVVFHGETIAAWREMKYHESEEHVSFRELLEAPQDETIPTRSNIPELWNLHSFFSKNKNSEKYFHFSSTHSNSVYSLGHFQPICTQSKMLHSSYNLYQLVSEIRNYLRDERCSKKLVLRTVKKFFTLRPPHTKIRLIYDFQSTYQVKSACLIQTTTQKMKQINL